MKNNNNSFIYFNSFGVEHIPKEIKEFINRGSLNSSTSHRPSSFVLRPPLCDASHNKNIITIIFRIQAYDSIMCGYFCIGFIDFMLKGKTLTEYTNLFSPNNFKKNDDIILNYFMGNI